MTETTEEPRRKSLTTVLRQVRLLVAKAEHEATPPEEARACQEKADQLMLDYAVNEAMLEADAPTAQRSLPGIIILPTAKWQTGLEGSLADLITHISQHCRCRARNWVRYTQDGYESKVFGFESDLRYVELLYTTLRLHMLGVLRPTVDPAASAESNAYRLHNAGYNWLQIAEMYGWHKMSSWEIGNLQGDVYLAVRELRDPYRKGEAHEDGEILSASKLGSGIKRAYYRECKRLGTQPVKIAANGTATYRRCAAQGYVSGIYKRLRRMDDGVEPGAALALRNREDELDAFFREQNADLFRSAPPRDEEEYVSHENCEKCKRASSGYCRDHRIRAYKEMPFDAAAYAAGARHAETADLFTGGTNMATKKGIE